MNDKAFREALSECLERIRLGDSVEACLEAHPQYAAQLASFLRAASTMKKIVPPQPSAAAMNNARNRLLGLVAEGGGKEAVMKGVFKFSHAMMAVGAVFLLSLGLVETGPEDPALKTEYEVLMAEAMVLQAIKAASLGPLSAKVDKLTLRLSGLGESLWAATMEQGTP